jgi:hypothetical protein
MHRAPPIATFLRLIAYDICTWSHVNCPAGRRLTVTALITRQLNGASHAGFRVVAGPVIPVLAAGVAGAGPVSAGLADLLPFRLIGIGVEGVFELLRAVVMLPARILGGSPRSR